MADALADPGADDGQVDSAAVARAALAALSPADGEIIELNLRHGLDGVDLADVLGLPAPQAHALVSRARSRFGTSLAIVGNRAGRGPCPDLAAIAAGRGGVLIAPLRRRVERHIEGCPACGCRLGQLSPAGMVFLLPAPILPASLPQRIFRLAVGAAPGVAAYRARVARGAEPFGADGFPVQLITPSVPRWRGNRRTAAVAAAATLALLGGAAYFVAYTAGHGEPPRVVATRAPAPVPTGPSRSSRAHALPPASRPVPAPARTPSQSAPTTPFSTTPAPTAPAGPAATTTAPVATAAPPATPPPTTPPPATAAPTTPPPTTPPPTTSPPTTSPPTTSPPTTSPPATPPPTTAPATTPPPTSAPPATPSPTTPPRTTPPPTTAPPTTPRPTTPGPTTPPPTTPAASSAGSP
jgi:hypothetical protein